MASSLNGTGITFSDSTTQSTAAVTGVTSLNGQTGAIVNTTFQAVGSIAFLANWSRSGYVSGATVNSANTGYITAFTGSWREIAYPFVRNGNVTVPGAATAQTNNATTVAVTGTWRVMGSATASMFDGCLTQTYAFAFLAVRVA